MRKKINIRWQLVIYDALILFLVDLLLLGFSGSELSASGMMIQGAIGFVAVFASRLLGSIYSQIWRYGGIQGYIRLLFPDTIAFMVTWIIERLLPIEHITFSRLLTIACMNLLGALSIRMLYRYAFKCGNNTTTLGKILLFILKLFAGNRIVGERTLDATKINVAIIGAGRIGVSLAEELLNNAVSAYTPRCFIDVSKEKVGRDIHGIPVLLEDEATLEQLKLLDIQEVVFAIPNLADDKKKSLYEHYQKAGYKIKVYDYLTMQTAGGKRHLREFDIEEMSC